MNIRQTVQKKLDNILLKYGILSHHLTRLDPKESVLNGVQINKNEYVVYEIITTPPHIRAEGQTIVSKHIIDINYYFAFDNNIAAQDDAMARVQEIADTLKQDECCVVNSEYRDIHTAPTGWRGINIELYIYEVK